MKIRWNKIEKRLRGYAHVFVLLREIKAVRTNRDPIYSCKNTKHLSLEKLLHYVSSHTDARGALYAVDNNSIADRDAGIFCAPFDVKRVFWITKIPQGSQRGAHAHRSCHELLICVAGSCTVKLTTSKESVEFRLDSPGLVLHIPPMVWCEISSFSTDCTLVCLASEAYSPSGYIHDFQEFMRQES